MATEEQCRKAALEFLSRVDLNAKEIPAWSAAVQWVNDAITPPTTKPDMEDPCPPDVVFEPVDLGDDE